MEVTLCWFVSQKRRSLQIKHHFQPHRKRHNNSFANANNHEAAYAGQKTMFGLWYLRDRFGASLPSCCI